MPIRRVGEEERKQTSGNHKLTQRKKVTKASHDAEAQTSRIHGESRLKRSEEHSSPQQAEKSIPNSRQQAVKSIANSRERNMPNSSEKSTERTRSAVP